MLKVNRIKAFDIFYVSLYPSYVHIKYGERVKSARMIKRAFATVFLFAVISKQSTQQITVSISDILFAIPVCFVNIEHECKQSGRKSRPLSVLGPRFPLSFPLERTV